MREHYSWVIEFVFIILITCVENSLTSQTLEGMLRVCVLEFSGSWDEYISLMEFAYNNQFHSIIGMAPYETLYERKCRSPLY